jgi:dipeptidyl aminopeptidase/acylaminoacyl peptidase
MQFIAIKPSPLALVAYWGYGDVDGDWYTKPSEFYRKSPLVGKADAFAAVGKKVISGVTNDTPDRAGRGRYYLFLRQNGLWTKEVTGFEPVKDRDKLDPYCPVRNISPEYPPILMVHGTLDTDVPYELSADMARELKRHKVPHELVTVPNAGHGLSGGDRELVARAHEKALAFIREQLSGK